MTVRQSTILAALALALIVGVAWWMRASRPPVAPPASAPARVADPARTPAAVPARAPARVPLEGVSPIAQELNAPTGSIRHDLELLNEVFVAWQTNFPRQGNPVGENNEITAALTGDNPLHFAFVAPDHRAINAQGELCDRWGTPFRFHQLSGTQMEIRSAGPDRRFGTDDDVQFAPWGNTP